MAKTYSAQEALDEVFRLLENDSENENDSGDENENGDLEELGQDVHFEKEAVERDIVEEEVDHVEIDIERDTQKQLVSNIIYHKKPLTKSRIVHSIDTAENELNYNPWVEPAEEINLVGRLDGRLLEYTNKMSVTKGKTRRQNVIKPPVGVRGHAKNATTPLSAFELFITPEYLEKLVLYTNLKISGILASLAERNFQFTNKHNFMREISIEEMQAFIGLFLYRGLLCLNNHGTEFLFSDQGPPIFGATMGRERFRFVTCFIRFDIETERAINYGSDRFAAFREFIEDFNQKSLEHMAPGDYLSLDETLYSMRNQIGFRIYIPNKPHKYGILFKSINAARFPYTFCCLPYSGKPDNIENAPYYVQGTENSVKYLVQLMQKFSFVDGRNITFDRLYTSIPLAVWLYSNGMTMIGTMQTNRKGIPDYLKDSKSKEPFHNEIYWLREGNDTGPMSLSSYTVKTKSKGKKNVLMLSTMDIPLGTTKDDNNNKMALYKLYDFSMGGTDTIDYRCARYSCKPKSRRWTMVAWCYTLDMYRCNSQSIFALNTGKDPMSIDSLSFGLKIVDAWVKPFIASRNLRGLQAPIIKKMEYVLDKKLKVHIPSANHPFPRTSDKDGRCHLCIKDCEGEGHKKKKSTLYRVKSCCMSCGQNTCSKHLISDCENCIVELTR